MTEVHHLSKPPSISTFRQPPHGATGPRVWPDDFDLVAMVESDYLDLVFQLTNSVDDSWWKNSEVRCLKREGARSTSVGDVLVNNQGRVFLVLPVGFKEIGTSERKIFLA